VNQCLRCSFSPYYTYCREFKLRVIWQTPGEEKITVSGNIKRVNELAVLKLQCTTILSPQERKYKTKTFNENFAKKVQICRLPFPETRSLNFLVFTMKNFLQ
jgi:hypothetical protein